MYGGSIFREKNWKFYFRWFLYIILKIDKNWHLFKKFADFPNNLQKSPKIKFSKVLEWFVTVREALMLFLVW